MRTLARSLKWWIAAGVAVAAVGTSGAFAYYNATGAGAGSTAVGNALALVISPATGSPLLAPGASGDVALTISNPNAYAAHVGSLALDTAHGDGGFAVDSGHSGCASPELSFTQQDNVGDGWLVPPRVGNVDGQLHLDLSDAVAMGVGADDACQGATFTVYLSAAS
jgi:hypothetical protein